MTTAIGGDETMKSLGERLVGARRALFAHYHIGGCSSCAYRDDETLAQVCERNELDLAEVIAVLEASEQHDREMLVEARQAKDLIDEGALLLDIRTREEHEAVAITGAEFLTQERQQQVLGSKEADGVVLLYDHRGRHVLDRVSWFRGHGCKQCYGIAGGIDAWAQEVEKSMPRYELEW